jgi:hypothetical protein
LYSLQKFLDLQSFLPILALLVLPDHFTRLHYGASVEPDQCLHVIIDKFLIFIINILVLYRMLIHLLDLLHIPFHVLVDAFIPLHAPILVWAVFEQ